MTQAPLGGKGFALKGMTKMLSGEIALKAGRHTIKIVIADARDTEKDSAVFVAAKSMTAALPMCYTVVSKECGKVQEQFVKVASAYPWGVQQYSLVQKILQDGRRASNFDGVKSTRG